MKSLNFKKIALFGGSFNPPHWAHRQVADHLRGLPQFDEVWVVPTFDHPFAKDLIPYAQRFDLCRLNFSNLGPTVKISDIEKTLQAKPSYMINTLRALKKDFPDHQFTIIVGSDCKNEIGKWKEAEALQKEAGFYFVPRPGFEESPFMDISSTQIRELIRQKKPVTKYLVPEVAKYIEDNKLYM